MAASANVIVFGAAGDIGSATALAAYQQGAKVTLAMRDTSKTIPRLKGIVAERVQADLTKPETIDTAVRQSGAKAAFIYACTGNSESNGLYDSIMALKEAGIESVVLLSSYTVGDSPQNRTPDEYAAWFPAQVEISLEKVFGKDHYAAVRPAYFASNILWLREGILMGEVHHPNPGGEHDWIAPEDIGQVCGMILSHGIKENPVLMLGAEPMTFQDAIAVVSRVLGKDVKVTQISRESALENMKVGAEEIFANWYIKYITDDAGYEFRHPAAAKAAGTVLKYTGKNPRSFQQWMEENKTKF
ncbi:hypothetical protein N7462_007774 [Penicillium macrosclerotiorum]|uniref:uncharacterized protein n=1 Tax=Penicillium macrosclerotiorum TaxID=303699 RepID=UPI00254709FD|nr:uncharacterized protein N7462_007774 [Penicillium macrosclerotiorum]KAJ5679530.1 hypothetical protein N7462_007774 [Penicillium macrosclerotiorum]